MNTYRQFPARRLVSICAAAILVFAMAAAAYAADFGGIRNTIQFWIHGKQEEAAWIYSEDGRWHVSWAGVNGETYENGARVMINEDGTERPATEEEILSDLGWWPEVEYHADGTIWVSYHDQYLDVTDQVRDKKTAKVILTEGHDKITIAFQNGRMIWMQHKLRTPCQHVGKNGQPTDNNP